MRVHEVRVGGGEWCARATRWSQRRRSWLVDPEYATTVCGDVLGRRLGVPGSAFEGVSCFVPCEKDTPRPRSPEVLTAQAGIWRFLVGRYDLKVGWSKGELIGSAGVQLRGQWEVVMR